MLLRLKEIGNPLNSKKSGRSSGQYEHTIEDRRRIDLG